MYKSKVLSHMCILGKSMYNVHFWLNLCNKKTRRIKQFHYSKTRSFFIHIGTGVHSSNISKLYCPKFQGRDEIFLLKRQGEYSQDSKGVTGVGCFFILALFGCHFHRNDNIRREGDWQPTHLSSRSAQTPMYLFL